jgi:hypothetical protein
MTTVQQVFDQAIHMMDEQSESTGTTNTNDTTEYKFRTISILNTILPSLYPYSDTCNVTYGRPVCPPLAVSDYRNPDFTQSIPLDDTLSMGVLPYALAGHLLAGENEDLSLWFMSRFQQTFADIRSRAAAGFEPISTPYGLF